MSFFRSPIYLNTDLLVPLANYHDIEVMVDVALSQRDRGERTGKAGANVGLPVPGSPGFEIGGTKGSESEVTQQRTVKDHPAHALNRLLDELTKSDDITDLPASVITRHQIVQCDGEWEISPATDVGAMLTSMVKMASQNPSVWDSSEPPAEFYELVSSDPERGSVVLETTLDGDEPLNVVVLLDSGYLVGRANLDSLEDDRTVFGQVDTFLPEGSQYSLEKFFLSGFSRAIRRNISAEQLLSGMEASFGKPMTIDDLKIDGPLVVVKPIAIY